MTDTKHSADLPPLPELRAIRAGHSFPKVYALGYTADQMQEYARAAIAAAAPAGEPVAITDSSAANGIKWYAPPAESMRNGVNLYAAPVPAAAPIPDGCARAWNGAIYHNITEIYHRMEEGEALHMVLDDKKIPRADADGAIYSLVGRVARLSEAAPKAALTDEQIDDLYRKHALSEAGPGEISFARAIESASGPNAALVEALQLLLNCDKNNSFGSRVHAVNKATAALAAAGVSHG